MIGLEPTSLVLKTNILNLYTTPYSFIFFVLLIQSNQIRMVGLEPTSIVPKTIIIPI